jgi:hypothetical protein
VVPLDPLSWPPESTLGKPLSFDELFELELESDELDVLDVVLDVALDACAAAATAITPARLAPARPAVTNAARRIPVSRFTGTSHDRHHVRSMVATRASRPLWRT